MKRLIWLLLIPFFLFPSACATKVIKVDTFERALVGSGEVETLSSKAERKQPTYSFDEWSRDDKILAGMATGLTLIDWGQTRDIAKRSKLKCTVKNSRASCDKTYYETNPFLGKNPTLKEIDTFMPVMLGVTLLGAHVQPREYRKLYLVVVVVTKLYLVTNNHIIGLRINF